MKITTFLVLCTFQMTSVFANNLDEVDISGNKPGYSERIIRSSIIKSSSLSTTVSSDSVTKVIFNIKKENGDIYSVELPELNIDCESHVLSYKFDNDLYRIKKSRVYELVDSIECNKTNIYEFDELSTEGQVLSIYHIVSKAIAKFKATNSLGFWTRRITMKWPGAGDYYNYNTVNVTQGHHWDVVGHELGHAIYDQANLGYSEGGGHKIDECYSTSLALSEGWASYFSAWISVDLDDADAKFEFLVPRRAPIQFEVIPADVCAGQENEWRVTGFFWDLIDISEDNESSSLTFENIFSHGLDKNFSTAKTYAKSLVDVGFDPILMNVIWKNNFLTEL